MSADRLPPHNLEAERGVLGSILVDPTTLDDIRPVLSPDDFFRDSHAAIYQVMLDLDGHGVALGWIAIADELDRRGELHRVGGDEAGAELYHAVPHAANAVQLAGIVRAKAVTRNLILAAHETIRECYAQQETADNLHARAAARVEAIHSSRAGGGAEPIRTAARQAIARIERRRAGEVVGVNTGLSDLDDLTDGMAPGQFIVVAARPSMGKTALALNVAAYAALEAAAPTLFVSAEMPKVELAERLIVAGARLDGHLLRTGRDLDPSEARRVARAHAALDATERLWVEDSGRVTPASILSEARRMRRAVGLELVVVDYLGLVKPSDPADRRKRLYEQVTDVSADLKAVARELNVPLLVLAQLNRASEARTDKRPTMADLRDSGAIEQDADVIWLLHRPEYYDPDDQPGEAELHVTKNRNGRTGRVRLTYLKHATRFEAWIPDPGNVPAEVSGRAY